MSDRLASRVPCPVCLGLKMGFVTVTTPGADLVLDHCRRCGGIWFDGGEVAALRALGPEALLTRVRPRRESARMRCRGCEAFVDRDEDRCRACAQENILDCPRCDVPMRAERAAGIRLDVCGGCKGVWLDNHELNTLWKVGLEHARRQVATGGRTGKAVGVARDVSGGALEAVLYAPDLAVYGLHAAGHAVGAVAGPAASGIGAPFEALGAAAEAVFELILEIIGGLAG